MASEQPVPVFKVHPSSREMLPADPLELQAVELPGDAELMLRLLVEEYARMGWDLESILQLARNPCYQAFHGLWRAYGEDVLRQRVAAVLARCGVTRVSQREVEAVSEEDQLIEDQLVQIDLPPPSYPGTSINTEA